MAALLGIDLSGAASHVPTLADAIAMLRLMNGYAVAQDASWFLSPSADVNGDEMIGVEEALYVVQTPGRGKGGGGRGK